MSKYKVAFVVADVSSSGGIERVTSILTKCLAERNIEITIVSLFRAHEKLRYTFSEQIKIVYLSNEKYATQKAGGINRVLLYFKIFSHLKSFFKENFFDFIIGQGFPVSFLLYMTNCRKRLICCEHVYYGYYGFFIQKIRIKIYKKSLHVVVLIDEDKDKFKKYLKNISIIPNPLPFKELNKKADLSAKRIISVGRLEPQKGFDLLLIASQEIFKKYPDWSLHIYGSGVQERELILQRDSLKLQNNVFFEGITGNIEKQYLNSSLYVLSSRFEGFGMVLIEAAACGLPIVAFDCPTGPRSILEGDKGILVKANDIDALTRDIINMIESKDKREYYAQKGPSIIAPYEPNLICDKWEYLFSNLTRNL